MRKKISDLKYFLLLILLVLPLACSNSSERKQVIKSAVIKEKKVLTEQEIAEKVARFEEYFAELQVKKSFNGAVLIAQGNEIILKKAFGYKNFRTKEMLPVDAEFQLASVSKQFTAAAIMILKQQGKLSYEDTLQKFFPKFPYKGITIKHLLTHQSGLSNYTYFCDKVCDRKTVIDNENVVTLMTTHRPAPYFSPGFRYDYSNTGYMLLAAVVSSVSKMKFEDFMEENIFRPSGMVNSYVYNHGTPISIKNAVEGYNGGRRKAGKTYLDGVLGDKGVYSTVEDLYKWDRVLYSDKILAQGILHEAYEPALKPKPNKDNYGYGWRIKDYNGDKVVWHGGWWEGYKTMFIRNLKDQTVIIVLTNSLSGHFKSNDLLDIYYNNKPDDDRKDDEN